jgi:DNA-binding transcriptional LysR family regulator
MTLKQLEAFYWAANLGSFTIAALRLHVTQSSLSKRIVELEGSVEAQLFDRSSKRAVLTQAGERLLPLARKMLDLRDQLHNEVLCSTGLVGVCRFGVSELVSLTWLPDFTRLVNQDHPALVLEPCVDLASHLERKVQRGELDFSVTTGPSPNPQLQGILIGQAEFAWAVSPRRLPSRTLLHRDDLQRHPVITMSEGSGLTRALKTWVETHGIAVHRTLGCNSLMAIVGLVLTDVGISCLPMQFIRPWVDEGMLVALQSAPPLPRLNYCFFQRSDDRRALLDVMRSNVLRVASFDAAPRSLTPFARIRKTT